MNLAVESKTMRISQRSEAHREWGFLDREWDSMRYSMVEIPLVRDLDFRGQL